nr:hypothetical protein [Tsukamurella sp. PLM1]
MRGESGAGKTTFLLALAGLDERGGRVLVDGAPAGGFADLPSVVGFFGEAGHVFATSVAENCRVARVPRRMPRSRRHCAGWAWGSGSTRCPPGSTPTSTAAPTRSPAASVGGSCWPAPW